MLYLLKHGNIGQSYNIVGDKLQVDQLAMKIAEIMNMNIKLQYEDFHNFRPGHDMHYGLNGTKMSNMGWVAPISMEQSLEKTVLWISRNKNWL